MDEIACTLLTEFYGLHKHLNSITTFIVVGVESSKVYDGTITVRYKVTPKENRWDSTNAKFLSEIEDTYIVSTNKKLIINLMLERLKIEIDSKQTEYNKVFQMYKHELE